MNLVDYNNKLYLIDCRYDAFKEVNMYAGEPMPIY